ncbi:hypothetical protein SLE2022_302390 [Rubroshorea leprosula]
MIQELLGGAGLIVGERKMPINGGILEGTPSVSPSPSSSPSSPTTSATNSAATSSNSESQNLRCPRCDSSNTKFCYYNNYNLTQPRHFCKTCRRYWTKGGALRNVPIGGGCRKNRNTGVSIGKSTCANKMRTVVSEIGLRSGLGNGSDHDPLLWASPKSSHILALLRANSQNPNPNPVKQEVGLMGSHSHGMTEPLVTGALNVRTLNSDPLSQVPSLGLCSPFWKNNQQNGIILSEVQNTGIQELYQRLKSSSTNHYSDNAAVIFSNVASSSSSTSILESAPVAAGGHELGCWNPVFSSWSDLQTTNGAYP